MVLRKGQLTSSWCLRWRCPSALFILLCPCLIYATTAEDLLELSCVTDAQCQEFQQPDKTQAHCHEGSCLCHAWHSSQTVVCRPSEHKVSNIIGGPCPCTQPNAECFAPQQQCYCAVGHAPSEDRRRCLPLSVPLKGSCELNSQCQSLDTFAVCSADKQQCICKPEFEPYKGKCLNVLQMHCSNDTDCSAGGASFCLKDQSKCACSTGYVRNRNMTKCEQGAAYGSSCDHTMPCHVLVGPGGICRMHRCSCKQQYYVRLKPENASRPELTHDERIVCQPIVAFGSYCRNDSDCEQHALEPVPQTMRCILGECHCKSNYQTLDNKECVLYNDAIRSLPLGYIWLACIFITTKILGI